MASSPTNLAERVAALESAWDVWGWYPGLIVGALTLLVIIFGAFSLGYVYWRAKAQARETADAVAREVAEQTANHYMQEHMDDILREHLALRRDAAPDAADEIGDMADDEGTP